MSKIKSESGIEILPEKYKGLYLRKHPKGVFGNPDFANRTRKTALFIDGCFWHRCPRHYRRPKSNTKFWDNHIGKTVARDKKVTRKLKREGWKVIRVWEHALKRRKSA
jgi:DNA mismatch endonuclease (patch repair protein)